MSSNKIDILTNMYVSARRELEREIKITTNEDIKAEYQQELDEIEVLYKELFNDLYKDSESERENK